MRWGRQQTSAQLGHCFGKAPVVFKAALPLPQVQRAAKEMLVACCAALSLTVTGEDALPAVLAQQ